MTDRELALSYCRAQEAGMVEALMSAEKEIARRLDIDPVYLQNRRFREEKIQGFVSDALAYSTEGVHFVWVRLLTQPVGIVRPENPFRFLSHEVASDEVGAMIVEGPLPIDPPEGWVVVLLQDSDQRYLCTTMKPEEVEVV